MALTTRARFHKLMNFEKVDRLPMVEWAPWWNLTIERWQSEGLPEVSRKDLFYNDAVAYDFGLDTYLQWWISPKVRPGFPRPKHHGAPLVESEADYEELKKVLFPDKLIGEGGARSLEYVQMLGRMQKEEEIVFFTTTEGPFWFPRTLFGIENHLYAFYDNPELMHRMNNDMTEFYLRALDQVCQYVTPDYTTYAEDMSYNHGPMVSEAIFNEFMAPYYKRLNTVYRQMGTRVIIDSDGDVTAAMPWFQKAGIEGVLPLERQAGVDINSMRQTFPDMLMIGGFNKLIMSHGEQAMREEFERVLPVMRQGGYIPSVDHQTPPDVSLETYRLYVRLLAEYTQKAADTFTGKLGAQA